MLLDVSSEQAGIVNDTHFAWSGPTMHELNRINEFLR